MNKYIQNISSHLFKMVLFVSFMLGFSGISSGQVTTTGNHVPENAEVTIDEDLSLTTADRWSTERALKGYFSALGEAKYLDADDDLNIDGYVKHYATAANQSYTFLVGTGSDLRALTISGKISANAVVATAWVAGQPTSHDITKKAGKLVEIMKEGEWDWIATDAEGTTVKVSIPDLTAYGYKAEELHLVGWNGTEWVDLHGNTNPTGIDEDKEVTGTVIAGIEAISVGFVDKTAPGAPVINKPVKDTDDKVSGTGEVGATVEVKLADGTTKTAIVKPNGTWEVPVSGLKGGDKVKATQTDTSGNKSEEAEVTVEFTDVTPPDAPKVNPINGKDPITGTTEPNAEVIVTLPNGDVVKVKADDEGNFTIDNPGLNDGDVVKVKAKDKAGNESPETEVTVDTVAPDAPVVNPINGKAPITGKTEPGAEVEITLPDGSKKTVIADDEGNWSIDNPGLNDGDVVKVKVTDPAGNESDSVTVTVDAIAPEAPVVNPINGKDPITGTTEPNAEVIVTMPNGDVVKVKADDEGNFTVDNPGLNDGDVVKVKVKDKAGNESPETEVTVDAKAPDAPVVNPINGKDPITGTTEPGAEVIVTLPNGDVVKVKADDEGNFTIDNPGLNDGDVVKVKVTDPAGNESPETEVTVDTVAPDAPVVNPVNGKDPITGKTEPGAEVEITLPDGSKKTVIADDEGNWSIDNPGLNDGDTITVKVTDPAGNESDSVTVTVDAIAPEAPTVDPIKDTDDKITGKGEAGTTVVVRLPDGSTETAEVDVDGNWEVQLSDKLTAGDVVIVTLADASGNISPAVEVTVVTLNAHCTKVWEAVEIPQLLTLNSDSLNETWDLVDLAKYCEECVKDSTLKNTVMIYNRYGALVFEAENYMFTDAKFEGKNEGSQGLDGEFLPEGVYYYVIKVEGQEVKTGYMYIVKKVMK